MAKYTMPDGNSYDFKNDAEATKALKAWDVQFGSGTQETSTEQSIKLPSAGNQLASMGIGVAGTLGKYAGRVLPGITGEELQAKTEKALTPEGYKLDPVSLNFARNVTDIGSAFALPGGVAKTVSKIPALAGEARAIATSGVDLGELATGSKAGDAILRGIVGGTTGGATGALVNPDDWWKGAVAGGVVSPLLGALKGTSATKVADLLKQKSINSTRDKTLKQSLDAGYVVPRSSYNPSAISSNIESIGGKAAIGQEAAKANQAVTDNLARKYLGIGEDVPFSQDTIDTLLEARSLPYRIAKELPAGKVGTKTITSGATGGKQSIDVVKDGATLVDSIKTARDDARALWTSINRGTTQSPNETRKAAMALDAQIKTLEGELDALARANKNPTLVQDLKKSRQDLAKIYSIEGAMNPATGEINASVIKRAFNRGAPLTGEAKIIADFANAFQRESRLGSSVPAPDVSKMNFIGKLLSTGAGAGLGGVPGAIVGGIAGEVVPTAAKAFALSPAMQKLPKYQQTLLQKMYGGLNGQPSQLATGLLLTSTKEE